MDSRDVVDWTFWIRWGTAFFASSLVALLATLPPFLPEPWRQVLMGAFATVCHQLPDRSPHINQVSLAVCHRCYGIYLGLPLAAIAAAMLRSIPVKKGILRYALFTTLALLALDWGAPLVGLWHNTAVSRMLTGLLFGMAAGWYLVEAIVNWKRSAC